LQDQRHDFALSRERRSGCFELTFGCQRRMSRFVHNTSLGGDILRTERAA
jgi:hypothetical protein